MIGKPLGHYEITDKLGKGGMGEVWRARDSKLGREVAIKTLPEEFARDEERLARFEREAKLLASLNHPNIEAPTSNDATTDPAVFVVPSYMRWDAKTEAEPEVLRAAIHEPGLGEVTHIRVLGPGLPSRSEPIRTLTENGIVEFASAEEHLLGWSSTAAGTIR